mgnify:CR=1 FL=1
MSRLTMNEAVEYLKGVGFKDSASAPFYPFYEEGSEYKKALDTLVKELQHYKDLEEQGRLIIGHKDPVGEQGPEGKGQWIDNHCSVCGMTPLGEEIWTHLDLDPPRFENYMNYCPNCGAKLAELKGTEE